MKKFLLPLLFALTGCAGTFEPDPLDIIEPLKYAADVSFCQAKGAAYIPKASVGDIAEAAFAGGAGSISYAPLNPLIPVLGAAGGGAAAASNASGFDLTGQSRKNVARHCLTDELAIDHAAIIARPEN